MTQTVITKNGKGLNQGNNIIIIILKAQKDSINQMAAGSSNNNQSKGALSLSLSLVVSSVFLGELSELHKFSTHRGPKHNFSLTFSGNKVVMDRDRRTIGSVKAAIDFYGDTTLEGNSSPKKPQMDFPEKSNSRTRELLLARRDIGRFSESRRVADSQKAQAESKLLKAKKTVRDLSLRIEESNSKAKLQIRDVGKLKNPSRRDESELALTHRNLESYQYEEVMRELEYVKQELNKLKLDVASVLEEKREAEMETRASSSKIQSYSSSIEALKREIHEANEEQVLVELARIEALKEFGAIEAQRKEEADQYSSTMVETRKKTDGLVQEIDHAKDLEMKLSVANYDINVLQNGLKLVKEMDKRVERNEGSFRKGEESESPTLLQSVMEELEAAKKELASIKEEGFQFMASMDVIREELKHVVDETIQLKISEEKTESTIQNLNSKFLRAKAKLETVSSAEEKAKSIVSNLSLSLEQLQSEAEAAKKEGELISIDTANIKTEVQKTESQIELAEERLEAAMKELETIKSSEEKALENLKALIDNTMRTRASASTNSTTIRISTFEYEYLTGRAVGAEEIADKKVAAAQAWIEALKAGEKEILMKAEMGSREIRELKVEEERAAIGAEREVSGKNGAELKVEEERPAYRTERQFSVKRVQKHEKNKEIENLKLDETKPRKVANRRAKFRNPVSPANGLTRSTSLNLKKRRKAVPNLVKFFSSKRIERNM